MQRVFYCKEKINDEFVLECATYNFSDVEEIKSATKDIVSKCGKLILNKYVHFLDEEIKEVNDKLYISGKPIILENDISDIDRKKYDEEFELSINAYKNNDIDGIDRWNKYLKEFENRFLNFKEIDIEE